jgi:hypothetical protein
VGFAIQPESAEPIMRSIGGTSKGLLSDCRRHFRALFCNFVIRASAKRVTRQRLLVKANLLAYPYWSWPAFQSAPLRASPAHPVKANNGLNSKAFRPAHFRKNGALSAFGFLRIWIEEGRIRMMKTLGPLLA